MLVFQYITDFKLVICYLGFFGYIHKWFGYNFLFMLGPHQDYVGNYDVCVFPSICGWNIRLTVNFFFFKYIIPVYFLYLPSWFLLKIKSICLDPAPTSWLPPEPLVFALLFPRIPRTKVSLKPMFPLELLPQLEQHKRRKWAWCWWLTRAILATQEAEIRRITVQSSPGKQFMRPYLEKTLHKKKGW
jgi:hypothetical protein